MHWSRDDDVHSRLHNLNLGTYMMSSTFWPCDVARDGFCYGWDHPALCVAGVLEVEEVRRMVTQYFPLMAAHVQDSHADVLLQRVARSAEAQALIRICGTPRILGRCVFSSFGRSSYPQPELKMFYGPSQSDTPRMSDIRLNLILGHTLLRTYITIVMMQILCGFMPWVRMEHAFSIFRIRSCARA